jgi:lon-related putative ATP-dependent protease
MGTLTTDFSLIKAGALHRANGGYLILDARSVLQQPFAWEALLRALKARCVKIESLGESLSLISTVSLQPEPIPLNVKVVLLGDRLLYYLLYAYEPDFAELFKVAADFDEQVDRTPENCRRFASFLATLVRHEDTRDLDRSGVACLMEYAARVAEDSQRLSVHSRTLAEVLQEANHAAAQESAKMIEARHVRQAIEQQIRRADRVRQRIYEEIERGCILIDTEGARVGQVNGLSLIDLGNFCFGQPSRITATARLGRGEVIDIEREVKLGGALHSKGVLILSSFLASRYAKNRPLSLSASLVFEQSYGSIEGDSASLAELCALLSALAEIPIRQSLAVTGSVNQLGQVQPIGGVNQKIEGFFDVCRRRGLTSSPGVLIPRANLPHLMLREDVVEAAAAGKFRVIALQTVDEAMSLLMGIPAGQQDSAGNFPEGSVNRRIESRLQDLADLRIQFGREQLADSQIKGPSP